MDIKQYAKNPKVISALERVGKEQYQDDNCVTLQKLVNSMVVYDGYDIEDIEWLLGNNEHTLEVLPEEIQHTYNEACRKRDLMSLGDIIKRLLSRTGDRTRSEIETEVKRVHRDRYTMKNIRRQMTVLVRDGELFERNDASGVPVLTINKPMFTDEKYRDIVSRGVRETEQRLRVLPHEDWNDAAQGGLVRGKLYGVCAKTGTGKTHFASSVAVQALKQGLNVMIISTEFDTCEYYELITETLTGSKAPTMLEWKEQYHDKYLEWSSVLEKYVDDTGQLDIPQMTRTVSCGELLHRIKQRGTDVVIFDYIQDGAIQLTRADREGQAGPKAMVSKIQQSLCTAAAHRQLGSTKPPAVIAILQTKQDWGEGSDMFPIAEITGEARGAYIQPFEMVFSLVDEVTEMGDIVKKKWVVSKGKKKHGTLGKPGRRFQTTLDINTNVTTEFLLRWDAYDFSIDEEN